MEGCQDLVQLSTPLPSVSAAMASSTGLDAITLPVALVATGAVVGAGATTAMTAPVATSATPRPRLSRPARHHVLRTRRVWRAYVHDHPRRARRPSRARCPRPPPHRRVRFDTASAVPTSARWRSEANASGRPGGHTATVRAVSRLRLISVRHASKNFKNLLGFFNLVPVGSFCAALREKTSTWPKLM